MGLFYNRNKSKNKETNSADSKVSQPTSSRNTDNVEELVDNPKPIMFPDNFEPDNRPCTISNVNNYDNEIRLRKKQQRINNVEEVCKMLDKYTVAQKGMDMTLFRRMIKKATKNILQKEEQQKEEHPFRKLAFHITDRKISAKERTNSLAQLLEKELKHLFGEDGDYEKSAHDMAEYFISDIDKKGITIENHPSISIGPMYSTFSNLLRQANKEGIDSGYRLNPIAPRIEALDDGRISSLPVNPVNFNTWLIAAGSLLNMKKGVGIYNLFDGDRTAELLARETHDQIFIEHGTLALITAEQFISACEINRISNDWIDGIPYYKNSLLENYIKEHNANPEDMLQDTHKTIMDILNSPPSTCCSECNEHIDPHSPVSVIRRSYAGINGSESFYCAKCRDRVINEFETMERNNRIAIIYENDQELSRS